MTGKNRLFSIGKLSTLTGVHIQSLRYYEELGILKPAYVDPQSGYRYYNFQHMRIVEAIQYCVELDIPLRQFRDFLLEEDGQIDYSRLIDDGIRLANEKMARMKARLAFLENVRREMLHARDCRANARIKSIFPELSLIHIFHAALYHLIADMEKHGVRAGYDNGQLLLCRGNEWKSYLFIDIREMRKPAEEFHQIITIPAGKYLCGIGEGSDIRSAPRMFPELFAQDYDKVVVLSLIHILCIRDRLYCGPDAVGLPAFWSGGWLKWDLGRSAGQPCDGQCRGWRRWNGVI